MNLLPVQVECYAGVKADETPRRFTLHSRTVEIGEVVDRWYQVESGPEWPRANYFKVRDPDQKEYLLKHDLESDEWFLGQEWSRFTKRYWLPAASGCFPTPHKLLRWKDWK